MSDVGAAPLLFECRPGQFAAVALRLLDAGPRGAVSWEELEAVVGGEDGAACIRAMVRANLLGYCPAMISGGKPEVGSETESARWGRTAPPPSGSGPTSWATVVLL